MTEQLNLGDASVYFDGESYDRNRGKARLSTLMSRVKAIMWSGNWFTLRTLAEQCKGAEASVSARIRDLRKERFGGYEVERKHLLDGVWVYRLKR